MVVAVKKHLGRGALVLLALAVAVALVALRGRGDNGTMNGSPAMDERRVPVVLTPATGREFVERLTVQGGVSAKHFVMVPARAGGTLERLFVDEGDEVVEGQTRLFEVDSVKFRKALDIARQDMEVARYARREREAHLRQVQAEHRKARLDYDRFEKLYEQRAVPLDAYEQQRTRLEQSQAMVEHAESLLNLAIEQQKQAETAAAIAEEDLSDTLVHAPISGTISMRLLERGEMADRGAPVFRIDDTSTVEVSARLPARYYGRVLVGETALRLRVHGADAGEHVVTYRSPTIDPALRTFEVRCVIHDPPEHVVPGAMANIDILVQKRPGLGVPLDAMQVRAGQPIVFTVEDETARLVPVETGLETDGWVEVISDELVEGTPIATMGQFQLSDGVRVRIQEDAG